MSQSKASSRDANLKVTKLMLDNQNKEQCEARTWWGTTVILSGLYSKFQTCLGYMILHLKNKMKKKSSSEKYYKIP